MLKLAQRHNPQAQFKLMDCREISLLNTTFDAIMCGFCLPYISWQDSQKLIQDMALLLKPDGILYLSFTEGDAEKEGFKGSDSSGGVIYVHYHNIEALKHCLAQSGLQVLGEKMITHTHNQESTEDIFILAKKPPMIK
jgi:ubiquinone/menaquinone biosynthesis C-methylase UbiE